MVSHRLRAPSADGSLLAEPPLIAASARLAENASQLGNWQYEFQGRSASRLRTLVRKQVIEKAKSFLNNAGLAFPEPGTGERLVVTGHQPELFHPGVWVKNFAAFEIAKQSRGVGLNLVVDNDLPKSNGIKVPVRQREGLHVERVLFDEWGGEIPYEDLRVSDESLFATFPERVHDVFAGDRSGMVLDSFWKHAVQFRGLTDRLGLRLSLARRAVEGSWGVRNLEVPLSAVCETEGFQWFAAHLLAHLPRYQDIHNDALQRYRELYGIRSRHHPVAALGRDGDWLEAPFWAWREGAPRRRPLLARQRGELLDLRIGGEAEPFLELPLGPDREACCAVEELQALPMRGIRLRTRALTTTMFSRYLLGDLFLHGIGGAKYDELGDEISGRFFGMTPPDYLTMSMTLWLGLGEAAGSTEGLNRVDRRLRDLSFNPEREVKSLAEGDGAEWVGKKRTAIAGPVETHFQRLERFQEIRRCNEALQALVKGRQEELVEHRAKLRAAVARNALAQSREYAFVLHSETRLRTALRRVIPGLSLEAE